MSSESSFVRDFSREFVPTGRQALNLLPLNFFDCVFPCTNQHGGGCCVASVTVGDGLNLGNILAELHCRDQILHKSNSISQRNFFGIAFLAQLDFGNTLGQSLAADGDS